ncbi:Hypothetical predicted protein [Marmota monax]|uniref:Uncharacterized protein n=1 Tax=Marmota monax TaxID=9995 RepID=A0A5E4C641_MARMO|nr:Hypothetical predicted protein [Marmota monax]
MAAPRWPPCMDLGAAFGVGAGTATSGRRGPAADTARAEEPGRRPGSRDPAGSAEQARARVVARAARGRAREGLRSPWLPRSAAVAGALDAVVPASRGRRRRERPVPSGPGLPRRPSGNGPRWAAARAPGPRGGGREAGARPRPPERDPEGAERPAGSPGVLGGPRRPDTGEVPPRWLLLLGMFIPK